MGRTSIRSLRRELPSWRRLRVRIRKGKEWGVAGGVHAGRGHIGTSLQKPRKTTDSDYLSRDILRWNPEEIKNS